MKCSIRSLCVSIMLCLALVACGAAPKETDWDAIVVGADDPAVDVAAVQAAVDGGGQILLRGTFDFGEEGRVLILRDGVTLSGERGKKDEYLTTIKGGSSTLLIGQNAPPPGLVAHEGDIAPVADTTLCDILFDGALGVAINVSAVSGETTIARCKFINPRFAPRWGQQWSMALHIGTVNCFHDSTMIQGRIQIAENIIDGGAVVHPNAQDDPDAIKCAGGYCRGYTHCIHLSNAEAQIHIVENTLGGALNDAIWFDNIVARTPLMTALIESNEISMPNVGNRAGAAIRSESMGALFVTRNSISSAHPMAECIWSDTSNHVVIERNDMQGSGCLDGTVSLEMSTSRAYVARNTIRGDGIAAFSVASWGGARCEENIFLDNDVDEFTPTESHYVFGKGACNNVVVGKACSVQDDGEENQCPPHGIVEAIRMRLEARRQRRETIRMVNGTE